MKKHLHSFVMAYSIGSLGVVSATLSTPAWSQEGQKQANPSAPASSTAPAPATNPQKPHQAHKAHQHGHALVQIAVQGMELAVRIEAPAEAMFGFEHKPRSEKEAEIIHDVEKRLKTDLLTMVGVDGGLGCHFEKLDVTHGLEEHASQPMAPAADKSGKKSKTEEHADLEVDAKGKCTQSPVGTKLKFAFIKEFKRIKKLKLEIISGEKVKSQTITKATEEVQL